MYHVVLSLYFQKAGCCTVDSMLLSCGLYACSVVRSKTVLWCTCWQCKGISHLWLVVETGWNVTTHGDAWVGKWRGNWRMEWVASTLHTTSKHGVSSITTADAHTSAASSRLNWLPRRFKWTRPFRRKTKSGFCACSITFQTQSTDSPADSLSTNEDLCSSVRAMNIGVEEFVLYTKEFCLSRNLICPCAHSSALLFNYKHRYYLEV